MKRTGILIVVISLVMMTFASCGKKKEPEVIPEVEKIRSICELATVECFYHNVAKSVKEAGSGISHIGEKDRKFWIEYSGIAKIGIDMTQVSIRVDGNMVYVTMPDAHVLSMNPNKDALNEESFISTEDSWLNSNKITADDQIYAINDAETTMKYSLESNRSLMQDAKERAEELIKNYINEIGKMTDIEYKVVFEDLGKTQKEEDDREVNDK